MKSPLDERMQRQNLSRLLEALRGLQLRRVTVTYAGVHGRVSSCDAIAWPADAEDRLAAVTVEQYRPIAPSSPYGESLSSEKLPLAQALQNFALHWANLLDAGWLRSDGGYGTMRIQVIEGVLTLDHDVVCIQNLHATLRATP